MKDKTLFKNGYSVIEKTFLSYLLDRNIPFLDGAPQLSFHRMISESGSSVMSLPYFPKKGTPYSYALDATLTTIPNTEILLLEFKTYIKVWIVEKPNNAFNLYFKESKTTNAYFYTPLTSAAIPSETTPKSFNQLCGVRDYVRATKLDGICHMTRSMARLCGRIVTIESVDEDGTYRIKEDRLPRQWWSNSMFEQKEPITPTELEKYMKVYNKKRPD